MTVRTCTPKTLRALKKAIGDKPYTAWAKSVGLPPTTVLAALSAEREDMKPISLSAKRENRILAALGMDLLPLPVGKVELLENQSVVTHDGPAPYVSRQIRLTPEQAVVFDQWVTELNKARSFNELWHRQLGVWLIGDDWNSVSGSPLQ